MPIQQVRQNKSRTEVFGDIFSGALGGIVQGKQLKRNKAKEDAMIIWKMAQDDPLVLQSPEAQKTFRDAGLPLPKGNITQRTIAELMASVPKGSRATYNLDPRTGRPTNFRVSPRVATQEGWGQINLLQNIRKNAEDAGNQEVMDLADQALKKIMSPTATPGVGEDSTLGVQPANASNVSLGQTPTLEEQMGNGPSQPSEPFIGPPTPPGFINPNWFKPAGSFTPPPAFNAPMVGFGSGIEAGSISPNQPGRSTAPNIAPRTPVAAAAKPAQQYIKIAINPKTGQRIGWDGTQWIPIQ